MGIRGEGEGQKAEVGGVQRGSKRGGSAFHFTLFICHDWVKKKKKAAISRCRRGAECIRMDRKWNSLSLSPFKIMMKNGLHTHILVLAVDVSQSAASPTMSNPVESWLKYLGWAELKKKKEQRRNERGKAVRWLQFEPFIWRRENWNTFFWCVYAEVVQKALKLSSSKRFNCRLEIAAAVTF